MNKAQLTRKPESSAKQYLSVQHKLAMAIGLDNRLQPMLQYFTDVCIECLNLEGMSYFMLQSSDDELTSVNEVGDVDIQHLLTVPDTLVDRRHMSECQFPELFFSKSSQFFCTSNADTQIHTTYFNLSDLGFTALYTKGELIDQKLLTLLLPIFHRLSISCQSSIEHEQLLQAISAKDKAEKIITHQLFHDELTGLANRRMLMQNLIKDIEYAKKNKKLGAVLYIDLDRFKSVNDTLGHSVGDHLLTTVAKKLSNIVRERDIVARLSGDEFAILLTDIRKETERDRSNIKRIILKIRDAFSKPLEAGDHILHITPSIGVETYPKSHSKLEATADRVMRNADTAMYLAKSKGPNASAFYDKKMSYELEKRLEVEKELQLAIKDLNQFELFYQPQYDAKGICVGAEALIRWSHPDQTLSSPGLFIPVAEETGLMLKLGKWVLIQACLHLKVLEETGIPPHFKKLSVNVSAVQFNQESFVDDLLSIIEKTGINPKRLTIELTESTLIDNVHDAVSKMTEMREHGIDISIDDFGTGYSSLAYLNKYPIATLKIDQTFVKDLHKDAGNRAIVSAMIGLGKNLNLSVIAEGVESFEELECLKEMQCSCYQGFHFYRPQPFEKLILLLE